MTKRCVSAAMLLTVWACASLAQPVYVPMECRITSVATAIVTDVKSPIGYLDEIYIQAPTRTTTSIVTIISAPYVGSNLTATVLFTNGTLSAAVRPRPRVTQTDNTGAALTSLTVAERFLCAGDPITFRVHQVGGVTSVTFRCWLKMDQ